MTLIFWGLAASGATGVSWMLARPFLGVSRRLPSAILLFIPLLTLIAYLVIGMPAQRDAPLAPRLEQPVASLPLGALIVKIEQRLKATPKDARGWQMLALLRQQQGAYDMAIRAWQNVVRSGGETADVWLAITENAIMQNQGFVDAAARQAVARAAQLAPDSPMVAYYLGLNLAQQGARDAAAKKWRAVLAMLDADDPLRPVVAMRLDELTSAENGPSPTSESRQ